MVSTMQRSPALAAEHAVVIGSPESVVPDMATASVAPETDFTVPKPTECPEPPCGREQGGELFARVGYGASVQIASSPIPSGILPRG